MRRRPTGRFLKPGFLSLAVALGCASIAQSDETVWPERFGFGSPAGEADIAAIDIDVLPDGSGLPPGRGTVEEGAAIYALQCAACHGQTGVEGPNDRLVARPGEAFPSGSSAESWQSRTIGNYWPYATTIFDYVRRSMPQTLPGSLEDDEVYALTAWLLWRNGIVEADTELSDANLAAVRMPARDRFIEDDRLDYTEVH